MPPPGAFPARCKERMSACMKKRSTRGSGLSRQEVMGYGLGDLACSMVFNFMSSYLLYYYTDVAGLTLGAAGMVMSGARLIDAASNPIAGALSDKTHTRWGKLRPWLLFSAVPLGISVVLMLLTAQTPAGMRSAYAMVTYGLFCLLYTVCNVPYSAMMPNLSEDPLQRARLNRARMACASTGSFLSMGLSLPLIGFFGQGNEQSGFLGLGFLFAGIIIVLVIVCFFSTKERVQSPPAALSLKSLGQTIGKSRPWVLCCVIQLFHYLATSTRNSAALYYAKYELGDQDFASLLLAAGSFMNFCAAFAVPLLVKRFSKRSVSLFGYGLFVLGSLCTGWAGGDTIQIFLLNCVANMGASLSVSVSFLILAETIDHSEYATGQRQQGLLTSVSMFMVKLGIVFSSAISALILDAWGYVPDQAQSAGALLGIRLNFIFLPALCGAICLALFLFYRLDKEYPAIHEALAKKREEREE